MANGEKATETSRAFGGAMAMAALIAGIAALWQPMNNRLTAVEKSNEEVRKAMIEVVRHDEMISQLEGEIGVGIRQLQKHEDSLEHPVLTNRVVTIGSGLMEIETKFHEQDRLIQLLWNRVYKESLPESGSKLKP